MGYTKKTLQELDLIDNFLSNAVASNKEINEPFYKLLLSVLLEKEIKTVKVLAQQIIPAATPELRGIRLDVEITEYDEARVTNVYDVEPHRKDQLHLPRHNRYYQAKIDGRYVKRGLKDFSQIPNLYVITITNYDIFGKDYMMYTVRNRCEEVPDLEYEDGLQFIYFYTKGQKGGSQAIKNMLTYFQNSDSKNAVDDATRMIDTYVRKVKSLPEVEAGYMTVGDWMDEMVEEIREAIEDEARAEAEKKISAEMEETRKKMRAEVEKEVREETEKIIREEMEETRKKMRAEVEKKARKETEKKVREETEKRVREENIKVFVETLQEFIDSKEMVAAKVREKYPDYAESADELVEKYWQDN
ncbi:MAG: hypothetical protein ACI4C4_13215 [Lachnospiraceae bacterium]